MKIRRNWHSCYAARNATAKFEGACAPKWRRIQTNLRTNCNYLKISLRVTAATNFRKIIFDVVNLEYDFEVRPSPEGATWRRRRAKFELPPIHGNLFMAGFSPSAEFWHILMRALVMLHWHLNNLTVEKKLLVYDVLRWFVDEVFRWLLIDENGFD